MKVTWLGQAGLMFETDNKVILIDPYLSDSVEKINPRNYRRVPVENRFLKIKPDVIVLTHNHLDHTDPETLKHYLSEESQITVLASQGAWNEARKFAGAGNNYVMFDRGTRWTEGNVVFYAVKAQHSDTHAIGVILCSEGKAYYVTGDTLYHKHIFEDLMEPIDVVFLPINGVGNNMNPTDAAQFAQKTGAKTVVPLHWGLFDEIDPRVFTCNGSVIPEIYQEILLK